MVSPYVSNTAADRRKMLDAIGVKSVEQLFSGIPERYRLKSKLNMPEVMSEFEVRQRFIAMMGEDAVNCRRRSFLGAGIYDHHSPSIVNHMTLRGEFLTAYTPYQPEISQGTLQVLFEFQTMVASLLGMDVAMASHYDGATALADAGLMGLRIKNKADRIFVGAALHPDYLATLKTYTAAQNCEIVMIPQVATSGQMDLVALEKAMQSCEPGHALVVAQSPNYFGVIEPMEKIAGMTRARENLMISVTAEALSLMLLKSPGECGAHIAVGEGQSLGLAPSFGGPLLGMFATRNEYLRQMPGRLCGMTKDAEGNDAFVLTLSTREQHIRRQKATSNICSNQNLCAVAATVHMATMGANGLKEAASQNLSLAEYLKSQVPSIKGASLAFKGPTFNEFVVRLPVAAKDVCQRALADHGVLAGIPVDTGSGNKDLLVAVTETKDRDDLDNWVRTIKKVLA